MLNLIDVDLSQTELAPVAENSLSPQIYDFLKFIVNRAGKSAVAIVNTCAMDNSPYWRAMFEVGMADAISEDPALESEFLGRMCEKPGLPYAHKLMDAYLREMPMDRKEKLFSIPGLKKRGHHFSICFYNASFQNSCGNHLLNVLKVMIEHGLPLQPILDRNYADIERAALLGHVDFLKTITQTGAKLPDALLQSILQRSSEVNDGRDVEVLNILLDQCGVELDQVLGEKVISFAGKTARSYLNARRVRAQRIPETELDPEEEGSLEFA